MDGTAETAMVRSAQLVGLTEHTALVVLVLSNARSKRAVDWPGELDESLVDTVTRGLRKALEGVSRSAVSLTVASWGRPMSTV